MEIPEDQNQLSHLILFSHRQIQFMIMQKFISLFYKRMEPSKSLGRLVRPIRVACCYEFDIISEQIPNASPNRIPMLTREDTSKIKFSNAEQYNKQPIYELLNELYDHSTSQDEIYSLLKQKRINSKHNEDREDLEYFVPQLVSYLIVQKNLEDPALKQLILSSCATDFYFAHHVLFYLKSFSVNHNRESLRNVCQFIQNQFQHSMNIYSRCRLSGQISKQFLEQPTSQPEEEPLEPVQKYGTKQYPNPMPQLPPPVLYIKQRYYKIEGFMDTPHFWEDLIEIGMRIGTVPPQLRNQVLEQSLSEININLPAGVYVPFSKNRIRTYSILAVWRGRVFSTKERAPYSIWLEIYKDEPQQMEIEVAEESMREQRARKKKNLLDQIYEALSKPFKKKKARKLQATQQLNHQSVSVLHTSMKRNTKFESFGDTFQNQRKMSLEKYQETFSDDCLSLQAPELDNSISVHQLPEKNSLQSTEFFSKTAAEFTQEVRMKSIYRNLQNWKLVHVMVKTGDDLKQEQFAMQLINRFQYIFKIEKIDCVVFPYEVISLGPDYGLIEMLNDVTTLDKLFQQLGQRNLTLRDFFQEHFKHRDQARRNFLNSLAGYCLLTYFLQIKDRHNGNILLHRDGYIIHIDFGFFLSNNPGRGVELQKKVPFKLLSQYVEVIGGFHSDEFFEFRQLFNQGFMAIIKHSQSIISLVRMMYSSHRDIMSCFIRGEESLIELQKRFNPPQNIDAFCYDLINQSLDNWRARWYDKFQYFLQKISY